MAYTNTYNATDIDDIVVDGVGGYLAQLVPFAPLFALGLAISVVGGAIAFIVYKMRLKK